MQTFAALAFASQVTFLVLYILFTEYGDASDATTGSDVDSQLEINMYSSFQHVNLMIFIGFGFLMTFLRKYGFSSVGFNFMLAALTIQWSILTNEFWHQLWADHWHTIKMDIAHLITGDFAAGAVLVSFGAVLGKLTPVQLLVMALVEVVIYGLNETIGVVDLEVVDMGGSIFVHTFGAYFGLGVAMALGRPQNTEHMGSNKNSDMFAMVGTLFLWMFWPSFNGALALGSQQHRVVINTVLALASCGVSAFVYSQLLRPDHKFNMVDIQNATLAGGVAVGSSADLVIQPWGAILIGMIAAGLSVVGYIYIQPFLEEKLGLHDTCGVHNLHGLPGLMGAVGGAISAALANDTEYGDSIANVFPARGGDDPRDAEEQGSYQFAAVVVAVAIASVGGYLTGKFLKSSLFHQSDNPFDDAEYWEIEGEEDEAHEDPRAAVEMVAAQAQEEA